MDEQRGQESLENPLYIHIHYTSTHEETHVAVRIRPAFCCYTHLRMPFIQECTKCTQHLSVWIVSNQVKWTLYLMMPLWPPNVMLQKIDLKRYNLNSEGRRPSDSIRAHSSLVLGTSNRCPRLPIRLYCVRWSDETVVPWHAPIMYVKKQCLEPFTLRRWYMVWMQDWKLSDECNFGPFWSTELMKFKNN
jgi:hypothetical protein